MVDLLTRLDEIDSIGNEAWLGSLDERKRAELEYHNRYRDPVFTQAARAAASDTFERFCGNAKYYSVTQRSFDYVKAWIAANARERVFLDYCCGNGRLAMHAAASGASLALGLDISDVSVGNARRVAAGISNVRFFQADAENTKLPDECVDCIVCSGVLHHLDFRYALPELRRILKPGGKILACEALDYNPAIKLYRMLTPDMRTEWEKAHILKLEDLQFAARFFTVSDTRYWYVVSYAAVKLPALRALLVATDRVLEKIPYVNRLAWMFTFCLTKPEHSGVSA